MKRLILSQPVFLLGFCVKDFGFLATQLAHFDNCLTALFLIIIVFEPILSVCFQQLKQYACMFYNDGNIFFDNML